MHEPSETSRNETPLPWRAVLSQPCTRTHAARRVALQQIDDAGGGAAHRSAAMPSRLASRRTAVATSSGFAAV